MAGLWLLLKNAVFTVAIMDEIMDAIFKRPSMKESILLNKFQEIDASNLSDRNKEVFKELLKGLSLSELAGMYAVWG